MNLPICDISGDDAPITLALVLIGGFALMSYAAFVEPFRAANVLAGRELFRWRHVSLDGAPVAASNGASFLVDQGLAPPGRETIVAVFAAGDPRAIVAPGLSAWLRRQERAGKVLTGVSAGPWLLARAGLLDRRRATIHWDHRDAFEQDFPSIAHEEALFVVDGRHVTCAGGMAGMDLAASLIAAMGLPELAGRVGEWFIHPGPRPAERAQRVGAQVRYPEAGPRVQAAIAAMEANLDEPLPREALAAAAGTSLRQLERQFAAALGEGVAAHYLRLRLERAAQLLRTTALSVTDIALACGFRASSHFSRSFRARYGIAPQRARATTGAGFPA